MAQILNVRTHWDGFKVRVQLLEGDPHLPCVEVLQFSYVDYLDANSTATPLFVTKYFALSKHIIQNVKKSLTFKFNFFFLWGCVEVVFRFLSIYRKYETLLLHEILISPFRNEWKHYITNFITMYFYVHKIHEIL